VALKVKGYRVFLVVCADGSYYSDWCQDLNKKIKEINARLETYFKKHPDRVPVKVAFHEDHIPFKEAYIKHKYLRSMTRRHRSRLIKTQAWPLGKMIREFLKKSG
jgi:predicted GIY-YIG superfamily endonuclease